ncbi:MAG: hypothetical protein R2764_00130 [Bacteroidales bacterium]
MKKYLLKIFYFSIPALILFLFIFLIDPYEYINISHIISSENKQLVYGRDDATSPRGGMLWKKLHYKRNPKKIILIGDSQGDNIKEDLVKRISGQDIYNFCVPGASYQTMFETFWLAAEQTELESVYFQVSFMNYNATRDYTLYSYIQKYVDKPYMYFLDKEILIDSFYNFLYAITKNRKLIENSYEYQSEEVLDEHSMEFMELIFDNYTYPVEFKKEMIRIADYCKKHEIETTYIIMPTYDETLITLMKTLLLKCIKLSKKTYRNSVIHMIIG